MAASKKYYQIKAKAADKAEIMIYEQIGKDYWDDTGVGAKEFAEDLKALGDIKQLDIRINSPGGCIFEGLAIYNTLKVHPAEKNIYIDGLAASIASVIAMSGKVIMPENALMMIHDPSGIVMGTPNDMRKMADILDKCKESIIMAYKDKTGMDEKDISDFMTDETWMNGKDAQTWGFCDEIIEPMKMAASLNTEQMKNFKNVPDGLILNNTVATPALSAGDPIQKPKKEVTTMKCNKHGCDLVDGKCPMCEIENKAAQDVQNERTRVANILAIGKEHGYNDLANKYIVEGKSDDDMRIEVLNKIRQGVKPDVQVTVENQAAKKPFKSFGEQLTAVARYASNRADAVEKERLFNITNAATGGAAAVPSDAGFLIQADFTTALLPQIQDNSILYSKCWNITVGADKNGLRAPIIDETSRVTGSRYGGITVYRKNEAPDLSTLGSKPKFALLELFLEDLFGVCFATEDMLADATALESIIMTVFPAEMGFVLDDEIIRGSGAGRMLGILNSNAVYAVDKESGQGAATIEIENIVKMISHMPSRSFAKAEWFINQDVLPQLYTLTLGTFPVYMPPGGASSTPYGTLYGKPINVIEQADTVGTKGDILLMDLSQYIVIDKGGVDAQQSIHVKFLTDERAFRFKMRNNGQPAWKKYKTPYKGSNYISPFVALADRA